VVVTLAMLVLLGAALVAGWLASSGERAKAGAAAARASAPRHGSASTADKPTAHAAAQAAASASAASAALPSVALPDSAVIRPGAIAPTLRPRLADAARAEAAKAEAARAKAASAVRTERPAHFALVGAPMRSRADAEALLRRLRAETARIRHPSATETSVMESPQGWRVSWWPFTTRKAAENAQRALGGQRIALEVVDF